MEIAIKIIAFEYLLTQMLKWGKDITPQVSTSSFTRLKALKLLFFASAVKDEEGRDLLDVFNNYYALPNGPVESDIYNSITSDDLSFYSFKDFSFGLKAPYREEGLDENLKQRIDAAIIALRSRNNDIVSYSAEQLVRLSHFWMSWQNSIQIANALGKGSYRMDVEQIRKNTQFFAL